MKKLKILNLKFIILFFTFYILHSTFYIPAASASEPSSPSAHLLQKLEALKKEVASKAAQLKSEVGKKTQNKVYLGQFLQAIDGKIIIKRNHQTATIKTDEFTLTSPKNMKINQLKEGDFVIALGDLDDTQALTAKKIVKLQESILKRQVFIAQILAISGNQLSLKTKDSVTKTQTSVSGLKPADSVVVAGEEREGRFKTRFIQKVTFGGKPL